VQILLQGFKDTDTAQAGSDHQDAIGFCRALRPHLPIKMLDILLKCHALRIEFTWRDIAPFATGVNAYMSGRAKTAVGKVGDAVWQSWVCEPCGKNQKRTLDMQSP